MHLPLDWHRRLTLSTMLPYFVENAVLTQHEIYRILSESFLMVKGAALFLQQGSSAQGPRTQSHHKHAGDLPQHLQVMINILRSEDRIKLAVRLESAWSERVRYMVVVYTSGRQDTEENILLGMDFSDKDSCSIGMVLPLWSDTKIHLDGDGGFSVTTAGRTRIFKPVSVQAMWSALQVLHKACEVSRRYNYFPGGIALIWTGYYESCISSEQSCINEWNAMQDLETLRPDSPAMFGDKPTERERTECLIKTKLRSIMMLQDLENVTSKEIRTELEQHMNCNLKEYKEFIDNEILLILGQMDKATLIFDHLYLGSEWNASNLEELQETGVGYILNVTREIDNFFPGTFCYHNVRVYDEETTDLLAHWNDTYNFIVRAKKNQSKCLVHCKMGVSRSASTVIAYAMKEYGWTLDKAYNFVKQKRSITRPNDSFMRQLAEYEGILDASKQRHNRLWHPDSECDHPDCQRPTAPCCTDPLSPGAGPSCCEAAAQSSPLALELDPSNPQNFNYYFRRLSDSALDSEPSTPVRMPPPLLDVDRVYIEIEDVERDALLDDEAFETPRFAAPAGEGTAAQTCTRGAEPLEELRLRLEFSTVEEEDEEEAKKEQEEMQALAEGGRREREGVGEESGIDLGKLNHLCNENSNNNNHLRTQNSLAESTLKKQTSKSRPVFSSSLTPSTVFDVGGSVFGPLTLCGVPSISVDVPTCTNVAIMAITPTRLWPCGPNCKCPKCSKTATDLCLASVSQPSDHKDKSRSQPQKPDHQKTKKDTALGLVLKENDGAAGKDKVEERLPGLPRDGNSQQKQEALDQLQRSGLVRRRAERLEKLSGMFQERFREHVAAQHSAETPERSSAAIDPLSGISDFWTSVPPAVEDTGALTLVSSPHGSTLTRSSSSDSIRSIRGKPGLVRQRAQEIEARMRLAGLTVPSRLKRSNSLAKLGSLTFSTEDLCSSACSSDAGTLLLLTLSPEPEGTISPEWDHDNLCSATTAMELFRPGAAGIPEPRS
ncbi:protein phosphatase Slingshot homolog 1 isoform X2 [Silurus meridionalis]|uniref:protein phosphatase Slingshot homolog 1 isoform X2 n=1 Tax=Silurus meridionalis TaxID=175797 RepID=UPI001EEB7407|nr:protein phosphatase Slingshot homolog 1 isoform X2 [Silurus meridionalis]KAI5091359.1 protein phosphatase Slingshot-like 1 isoform X1 [Silurus meridionalis]